MPDPINKQTVNTSDYVSQDDKFAMDAPQFYPERQYIERRAPIHQSDIPVGTIKQRHIQPNALLIFTGLSADRPDGSSFVKAYFATDTFVLSIWTGTAWKSATLT